jgi:hypothetical protein
MLKTMRYRLGVLLIGIMLVVFSLFMKPYRDEKSFSEKYSELSASLETGGSISSSVRSEQFHRLRRECETSKYRVLDYGITCILLSLMVSLFRRFESLQSCPKHLLSYFGLALAFPTAFTGGYITDLLVAFERGEFPRWADSLGIPFAGVPVIFGFLLLVSGLLTFFLPWTKLTTAHFRSAIQWPVNVPLAMIASGIGLMTLFFLALGQWWYWLPFAMFLYQAASLIVVRKASK